jgi:hypothetical protein
MTMFVNGFKKSLLCFKNKSTLFLKTFNKLFTCHKNFTPYRNSLKKRVLIFSEANLLLINKSINKKQTNEKGGRMASLNRGKGWPYHLCYG